MIHQLILVRAIDFPFLAGSTATKDPAELRQRLFLLDKRLREMLGDFNGSFRTLGIPSLDWTLQLTPKPPKKTRQPPSSWSFP